VSCPSWEFEALSAECFLVARDEMPSLV